MDRRVIEKAIDANWSKGRSPGGRKSNRTCESTKASPMGQPRKSVTATPRATELARKQAIRRRAENATDRIAHEMTLGSTRALSVCEPKVGLTLGGARG